ncbi:MAG TPA: V-type ATP synthase subunit A [Thermoplasmata archaeon]|nr:V-type ATP synthase subunit A [Thermoplasmata archaeon]
MAKGRVVRISGPVVEAEGLPEAKMAEVVRVGKDRLIGEIVEVRGERVVIQVYEETTGVGLDDVVEATGEPLSVELGPGLIGSIYDGIQRPLNLIASISGDFIGRGMAPEALDREKKWSFKPLTAVGELVEGGDILGTLQESPLIEHKIMVPPDTKGKLTSIFEGEFCIEEVVAVVEDEEGMEREITMLQKWPVRVPRPYKEKKPVSEPMITGQRILDTLFPIAKGGAGCVPGPFGSGKTVVQHQLAKWADADIIVYVGCGERGNEMCQVLKEFPELVDPNTGRPLMERTILVANTSNMPFAAREASVYTGITIAEYYRDMGYNVALMADSTSRWAEALREISGRLEEMPGEEGYPAYLASRIAGFYERAGKVLTLGKGERYGTLTVMGAVSPPGGDLSEPTSQATLRTVKVFWSLDSELAYKRHFPAINWLRAYSLYLDNVEDWWKKHTGQDWKEKRAMAMRILQEEAELTDIVKLVGVESLSPKDRFTLDVARSLREDFLYQNAFHEIDTYTSARKQYMLLKLVLFYAEAGFEALSKGADIEKMLKLEVKEDIAKARLVKEEEVFEVYKSIVKKINEQFSQLIEGKLEIKEDIFENNPNLLYRKPLNQKGGDA